MTMSRPPFWEELLEELRRRPDLRQELAELLFSEAPFLTWKEEVREYWRRQEVHRAEIYATLERMAQRDEQLEAALQRLTERVDRLAQRQEKTEEALQRLTERVNRLAQRQEKTEEALQRLAQRQEKTEEALQRLAQRQEKTEEALQRLAQRQEKTEEALQRLTERVDQLTQRVDDLTERLDQLTQRVDDLARRLDQLTQRVDDLARRLDQLTQRVDDLTRRLDQLTQRVDDLTERLDQLTQRVDDLTRRLDRLAERLEQLTERLERLEAFVEALAKDLRRIIWRYDRTVPALVGAVAEMRFQQRAPALVGVHGFRRARALETHEWVALLEDALDEGRISESEFRDAIRVDAVVRARQGGEQVYLIFEVSGALYEEDVYRALRRAEIWAKVTQTRTLPGVAGKGIQPPAQELAQERGVMVITDGLLPEFDLDALWRQEQEAGGPHSA